MNILSAIFVFMRGKGVWEQNARGFQVKLNVLEIRVVGGVEWWQQNDNKNSCCFV